MKIDNLAVHSSWNPQLFITFTYLSVSFVVLVTKFSSRPKRVKGQFGHDAIGDVEENPEAREAAFPSARPGFPEGN